MHGHNVAAESVDAFTWIAVEPEPPFEIQVFSATPEWLERGEQRFRRALHAVRACRKHNDYSGLSNHVVSLSVPIYAL